MSTVLKNIIWSLDCLNKIELYFPVGRYSIITVTESAILIAKSNDIWRARNGRRWDIFTILAKDIANLKKYTMAEGLTREHCVLDLWCSRKYVLKYFLLGMKVVYDVFRDKNWSSAVGFWHVMVLYLFFLSRLLSWVLKNVFFWILMYHFMVDGKDYMYLKA